MWLLDNATPFAAERTWVRDRDGAELWVVAVKASFLVGQDGHERLDPAQTDVLRVPKFAGAPDASSLLHETDLVQLKRRTDVLVQGHACAPYGEAVQSIDVRLRVAGIDKTLRVNGDRTITRGVFGLSLSEPQPFVSMPLTWERSFGGTDTKDVNAARHRWEPRNPVGTGFGTEAEHVIGTPAPNVEDPRAPYQGAQKGTPAGFGPVARHWMPRVTLAGTYDKEWEDTRKPLLPEDFDDRFYQSAPEDQQVDGFLKGGEIVELRNATPDAHFTFPVPRVTLLMTTRFYDGTVAEHRPVVHTLTIQPDRRRFEIVWHSALPCHQRVNKLAITRVAFKHRVNVPRAEVESGMWMGG
jgi:hypothetical protein